MKAETRALEKAGKLEPAGPGGTQAERMAPPPKSTKTRAERKAETLAASKGRAETGRIGTLEGRADGRPAEIDEDARRAQGRDARGRAREAVAPAGEGPGAPKK